MAVDPLAGCVTAAGGCTNETDAEYVVLITPDQVLCHVVGDFFLQSDWQATNKYSKLWVAFVHAVLYMLPFLLLTQSPAALATICITHALIDHYKLASYVAWIKNWIALVRPPAWRNCTLTGYDPDRPLWLTAWLMIIVDNTMHVVINAAAIKYF